MNTTVHPLVQGYLRSLDGAAKVLPRRERDELIAEIRAPLDQAIAPGATEADVRNALDSLGAPWDIVAAAGGQPTTVRRGAREVFALILLVTGGFPVPILGWFIGLGLLIWSPLWNAKQKWLGALVWPGGWFSLFLLVSVAAGGSSTSLQMCSGGPSGSATCTTTSQSTPLWEWLPLTVVAIGLPIVVAVYLWRAAGRQSAA